MRFHGLALSFVATLIALVFAQPARANVMIVIDKSAQKMTVTVNGEERYVWPVSTGHSGYDTPSGDFQPFRMERTTVRKSGTTRRCRIRFSFRMVGSDGGS